MMGMIANQMLIDFISRMKQKAALRKEQGKCEKDQENKKDGEPEKK